MLLLLCSWMGLGMLAGSTGEWPAEADAIEDPDDTDVVRGLPPADALRRFDPWDS